MTEEKSRHYDAGSALLVQKHQVDTLDRKTLEVASGVSSLEQLQRETIDEFNALNDQLDSLLALKGVEFSEASAEMSIDVELLLDESERKVRSEFHSIEEVGQVDYSEDMDWDGYINSVHKYAEENGIDLSKDPFEQLMSDSQRVELEKRIDEDLTYKNANCDEYDYMIAGTCGMIGGLIDIFFVGIPGDSSFINKGADAFVDKSVQGFASLMGWEGAREGSDSTKSAIGYLERKYKVNYDQRSSVDSQGKVKLSTINHHIKSLAHSPDIVGLFFSILSQFTNTAHFVEGGQLIAIDTDDFELKGHNFPAKVFCGFVNWLGHLFSDTAGSSGAQGRGSGIPIPFYSLLQFLDVGKFGKHDDSFAKVAVKVFEQGYDLRHGIAMSIPVLITELLTRISWTVKQRYYHEKEWADCMPSTSNPELRRMLLVSHGTLCLMDGIDAGLRSGGNIVSFMLRANLIAWGRFGVSAVKEVNAWYLTGKLDVEAANEELDKEYERLLGNVRVN